MALPRRLAIVGFLVVLAGCERSVQLTGKSPETETYVSDPDSLGFDLFKFNPTGNSSQTTRHTRRPRDFAFSLTPQFPRLRTSPLARAESFLRLVPIRQLS